MLGMLLHSYPQELGDLWVLSHSGLHDETVSKEKRINLKITKVEGGKSNL